MKRIYIKQKGFTLVEIITAIAILFIVMGIVFPMFNSNLKTLNETEIRTDLQREGQHVMKRISESTMEAEKITKIIDTDGGNRLTTSSAIEVSIKEFEVATDNNVTYDFKLEGGVLKYTKSSGENQISNYEVAKDIQSIEIETTDGKNYDQCEGVTIKITLSKNNIKYDIDSKVYFRNKQ